MGIFYPIYSKTVSPSTKFLTLLDVSNKEFFTLFNHYIYCAKVIENIYAVVGYNLRDCKKVELVLRANVGVNKYV